MSSSVSRAAFGAWVGAASVFVALRIFGMADEARPLLGTLFLFSGMQLGALAYGARRERGDG